MRIAVIASLVVALAALAVAAWALFHKPSGDDYSDAQVADATAKICSAYDLAYSGVKLQNKSSGVGMTLRDRWPRPRMRASPSSPDPRICSNDDAPAAPGPLKDAVRQLAAAYRAVALNYLAGETIDSPSIKAALQDAGFAATTIDATCKK